jgi:hypothetical protein
MRQVPRCEKTMQRRIFAALCGVLFASTTAIAQQTHIAAFDAPASGNNYTQQYILEIGDVPGHKLRLYELVHRLWWQRPVNRGHHS